jgi:hypothetical protein
MQKFAVDLVWTLVEFEDVKVNGIVGLVSVAVLDYLLNKSYDLRHVLGDSCDNIWIFYI